MKPVEIHKTPKRDLMWKLESMIVIQRFQQIIPGSPQQSSMGRLFFFDTLDTLMVFLVCLGCFPSLVARLSQGAGNGNSEVGVGELWREREGNSPPDPGVTPRSPNLDLRGALWKRTTEFFGTLCSPPIPPHHYHTTYTHTHNYKNTHFSVFLMATP